MEDQITPSAEGKEELQAGAVPEPTKEVEEGKPEGKEAPSTGKTYSEEEHKAAVEAERKRYSGLDSKYSKEKSEWAEAKRQHDAALEQARTQAEEARYADFLRSTEDGGGDMMAAQKIVERERVVAKREREAESLKAWVSQQQVILNEASKGRQADELIKEHELDPKQLGKLLDAKDPVEMENIALRLRLEKSKVEQKPATKVDPGQGKKGGGDLSKLPPSIALGQLMEQ